MHVLELPLSTFTALESALTRILVLLEGGASCPPHVLGLLKRALGQLYPAVDDPSMADKLREAVVALGGRAKRAKQDPPTTPARLLARMQDAEDDENLGFDLSATWASFADETTAQQGRADCAGAPHLGPVTHYIIFGAGPVFLSELLPYERDVRIVSAIRQDHFSVRALGRRFQIAMERAGRTMLYDAVASFASASRRTARRWDR